jgi:ribonuclease HI
MAESKKFLKVVQWNLRRSKAATEAVMLNRGKHSLALIQEPYVGPGGRIPGAAGAVIFQSGTASKAAVVVFDGIFTGLLRSDLSGPNMVFVEAVSGGKTTIFGSCYSEPLGDLDGIMNVLKELRRGELLVGGDFNAKNIWWGSNKTNHRGTTLMDCIAENNLFIINTGKKPTFETCRAGVWCRSVIDITLASSSIADTVCGWNVSEYDSELSDHKQLHFVMNVNMSASARESTRLYNTNRADWKKFETTYLNECGAHNIQPDKLLHSPSAASLEDMIDEWMNVIDKACKGSMKELRSFRTKRRWVWWNKDLTDLKVCMRRTKRQMQNSASVWRRDTLLQEFIRMKEDFRKAKAEAKRNSWRMFCEGQKYESIWKSLYRVLKAKRRPAPSNLHCNGIFFGSGNDTATGILNHFFPVVDGGDLQPSLDTDNLGLPDHPFTIEEIKQILDRMNPKKSPGEDHMDASIVAGTFRAHPEIFVAVYNACLALSIFPRCWKTSLAVLIPKGGKEDQSDIRSYRPIGLISCFGKVLEALLKNRLMWFLYSTESMGLNQYGFTPQRSTEDALFDMVERIREAKGRRRVVILISLDIQGAFDNAAWSIILKELWRKKCPRNVFDLVRSYFCNRTVRIKYAGHEAERAVQKGCVQGSVCGPLFWNLIIDGLLCRDWENGVAISAFADDVAMVIQGEDIYTVGRLASRTLDSVVEWGDSVGLTFSKEKTQLIHFDKGGREVPCITMGGIELSFTDHLKILGVVIDRHLRWNHHVDYVCAKAAKVVNSVSATVRATWGLSPEMTRLLYFGAVEPVITYASSVWSSALRYKVYKKKLERIQRPMALRICRAYRTVSTTAALALAGTIPLWLRVEERARVYLVRKTGITKELPDDRLLEEVVPFWSLPHPALRKIPQCMIEEGMPELEMSELAIFTDGSKSDSGVGAAFVSFFQGEELRHRKFLLDRICSVFQAELFAIKEALRWATSVRSVEWHKICIITDSRSALEGIKDFSTVNYLIVKIKELAAELTSRGFELRFVWIRGHTGVAGNERADQLAREAARKRTSPDYARFTLSFAKHLVKASVFDRWQVEYGQSEQGEWTRSLFPELRMAARFTRICGLSFDLTQALTGHGCFRFYLHRFRIIDSPSCPCDGTTPQNVLHLLYECKLLESERRECSDRCRRDGIQWSETDVKEAIRNGRSMEMIGACMKHLVWRVREMAAAVSDNEST